MAKLRIVKERTSNEDPKTDLRGWGDQDLFQNSGFKIKLVVHHHAQSLGEILQAYQLALEPSEGASASDPEFCVAHAVNSSPGTHKYQALSAFFAAMEISQQHRDSRVLIYQENGLASQIEERTRGKDVGEHPAISEWKASKHRFSLHQSVALYIMQSGISVRQSQDQMIHLDETDIQGIHRELTRDLSAESAPDHKRKVG